MLANFIKAGLLLVRMFSASETVEFIQFDVLRRHACDDCLIGGFGLQTGALNPALNGGRMHAFDASNRLWAQPFKALLNGALDFLLWRLEIVEGRPEAVAKSFLALLAANDKDGLTAPQCVATVKG
jgi:hypothetical protein